MNEAIQIFHSPEFGNIRTTGSSDYPYFCLTDICDVLDLQPAAVVRRLADDVITSHPITDSMGRQQIATFVSEDGLYDVILDSRKPEAKKFRKWVTSEVLPTIRSHGAYMTPQKIEEVLANPDLIIGLATQLKEERQRVEALSQDVVMLGAKTIDQEKALAAAAPKVLFADCVTGSEKSILVADLAKILKQNGIEIGQNRLFVWLRDHGYLCSKGAYYNRPTQKAMELGLFEVIERTIGAPDKELTTFTTKVTGKGQLYFVNKFLYNKQ